MVRVDFLTQITLISRIAADYWFADSRMVGIQKLICVNLRNLRNLRQRLFSESPL